jgi:hypothetical protein
MWKSVVGLFTDVRPAERQRLGRRRDVHACAMSR